MNQVTRYQLLHMTAVLALMLGGGLFVMHMGEASLQDKPTMMMRNFGIFFVWSLGCLAVMLHFKRKVYALQKDGMRVMRWAIWLNIGLYALAGYAVYAYAPTYASADLARRSAQTQAIAPDLSGEASGWRDK